MARKKKRGRPLTFKPATRNRYADLIRRYGVRGAQVHSSKAISLSTLLKIAREFGIELKKGRRGRHISAQSAAMMDDSSPNQAA